MIRPAQDPLDEQAVKAANKRAVYYGTAGVLDPRTYTIDALALRSTGMTYMHALGVSVPMAVLAPAATGYVGLDPLNVTPGYGVTPPSRGRFRKAIDLFRHIFDLRSLYM